jgi:DNA-binding HxlR family transcriptional regulator
MQTALAPTILAMTSALDRALDRVGDRWTLLVVDALLGGPRKFGELEAAVPGIAPNILSDRLKRLAGDGLVIAEAYSERPPRYEYRLTAAGRDLGGVLTLLARWGAAGDEAALPRHEACGTPADVHWHCPTCDVPIDPGEATTIRYV